MKSIFCITQYLFLYYKISFNQTNIIKCVQKLFAKLHMITSLTFSPLKLFSFYLFTFSFLLSPPPPYLIPLLLSSFAIFLFPEIFLCCLKVIPLSLSFLMHKLNKYTVGEIILLPTKYEIILLPSNHSFFEYCDSILFGIRSLLLF